MRTPFLLTLLLVSTLCHAAQIVGSVTCDGKAVAGAVISDGYSVTKTDTKGLYSITSDPNAEFVFISLPAGYAIADPAAVCPFWARIDEGKATQHHDFQLRKTDDGRAVILAVADMHVSGLHRPKADYPDTVWLAKYFLPDLAQTVAAYPAGTRVVGLNLGDMVFEHYRFTNNVWYPDYIKVISQTGIPFFHVIGNHDYDDTARTGDRDCEREYRKYLGPTYYSLTVGHVHIVMLDDMIYLNAEGKRDMLCEISAEQIDWLKKDLAAMPATVRNVIVGLHCPTARRHPSSKQKVTNREELYALLAPYEAKILAGHNHICETVTITPTLHEYLMPSIAGTTWYSTVCTDGSPAGYGVFEVEGDKVTHRKKFIGYPDDFQFRLYNKECFNDEGAETIVLNIFDWDESWTVTATQNGHGVKVARPLMTDPHFTKDIYAQGVVSTAAYCRPAKSDHIFTITPPDADGEVTITVTNPANGYTKTVSTKLEM